MQRIGRIEAANQNTFNLDRDEGELGINCDKSQVERFEQTIEEAAISHLDEADDAVMLTNPLTKLLS